MKRLLTEKQKRANRLNLAKWEDRQRAVAFLSGACFLAVLLMLLIDFGK